MFMRLAVEQARAAAVSGEVPVGAVVVKNGQVIATGRNSSIHTHDPTGHAEIQALRAAAAVLGNYRLDGCELFVTLEPCAMCAGAMLHARLDRVVFGATDPKTGAAGSVINVFAQAQLNHHTQVQGRTMADECASELQEFFRQRRDLQSRTRRAHHPLRDDALRTSDSHFLALPDYPWQPRYINHLPSLAGLRMHYLDEGPRSAPRTYVCLHRTPVWSYFFRHMIPLFLESGARVVAPDLIGFGKSDKPKKESVHHFSFHQQTLLELIKELDLRQVVLVVQGATNFLGLTLPLIEPERFIGTVVVDSPCNAMDCASCSAPFPNTGHRAAVSAFESGAADPQDRGKDVLTRQILDPMRTQWPGKMLWAQAGQPPVSGLPVEQFLLQAMENGTASRWNPTDAVHGEDSAWHREIATVTLTCFGAGT